MSKDERMFDLELLNASNDEKTKFFEEYTLAHPHFMKVKNEVIKEIKEQNYNIIMVIGPSRIGKSRMILEIIDEINKEMNKEMSENQSIIPVSGMELPNPDSRKFNWKDFYKRVLLAMSEEMVEYKVNLNDLMNKKKSKSISPFDSNTSPELRQSIERVFYHRETKAFLIDEAQHFFKIGGGSDALITQFNSIKSLSNMAGTVFVMFGTYDLNTMINLDGQLTSRVKEIHFPRYDNKDKTDMNFFKGCIYSFQKLIPVSIEPQLVQHTQYLYENSIGCIGILKQWLQRSLNQALRENANTVTLDHLKQNALSLKKVFRLASEAVHGEMQFLENEELREMIRKLYKGELEEDSRDTQSEKDSSSKRITNNKKPGIPNPVRNKVGNL
jgi:hypothetical protein